MGSYIKSTYVYIFSRKDSRYTEKDAAVVVRQMLKVAAECHLRGLVHRDMKPEVGTIQFDSMLGNCKSICESIFITLRRVMIPYPLRIFCSNQPKKVHL